MTDALVLLFIVAAIAIAFVLTRKKPQAAAAPEAPKKPIVADDEEAAPQPAPAQAAEGGPVHEIKDEKTHADEVAALKAANEPAGPTLAAAMFRWSIAIARTGDMRRALPVMREAASMPSTDAASEKERLTFVMNLGEMLARTGQLDEAEKVLRDSLPAREAAFGRLHPAYAFGLAPLARLLLAKGDFPSASQAADEVVAVLGAARHDNMSMGQGLQAAAAIAAGRAPASAEKIETSALSGYLAGLLDACDVLPAELESRVLAYAANMLSERGLLATQAGVRVLDRYAQSSRNRGALDEAALAWSKLAEVAFALKQADLAVQAMLGVAIVRAEAGDANGANAAFEELSAKVAEAPAALKSRVAREHGLFLTQVNKDLALAKLSEAVALGRESQDAEVLGRAVAAEGVWRLHAGEFDAAAALLEEAQKILPANHPESRAVANHLEAAKKKGPCDCGRDNRSEVEKVLNQAVSQALSPDLVRVRVNPGPRGVQYGLEFARQPTPEELEKAKVALETALKKLASANAPVAQPAQA